MKNQCVICGKEITGHHITYLPANHTICENECLLKYRKKHNENKKTKKSRT